MAIDTKKPSSETGIGAGLVRAGRFFIDSNSPLLAYHTVSARAFYAMDDINQPANYFAVITDSKYPCRLNHISVVSELGLSNFLVPLEVTAVPDFAFHSGRSTLALIYPSLPGEPYVSEWRNENQPLPLRYATDHFLLPVERLLKKLHGINVAHRGINPTHIYNLPGPIKRHFIFGDFLAEPAGVLQPAVCEPIEGMQSHLAGRGELDLSADMYAVGVTLIALLTGSMPLNWLSDQEILDQKLSQGSFITLTKNFTAAPHVLELLRGMLQDDFRARWTIREFSSWLGGARSKSKGREKVTRSRIPFDFNGEKYYSGRVLAEALTHSWDVAAEAELTADVLLWLKRTYTEDARVPLLISELQNPRENRDQKYFSVAFIIRLIDPYAPLRYDSISTMVSALGNYLCANAGDFHIEQNLESMLRGGLLPKWFEVPAPEYPGEKNSIDRVRSAHKSFIDLGLVAEGLAYKLCLEMSCRSEILKDSYVVSMSELIEAYNVIADADYTKGIPIDNRIIAFILARADNSLRPLVISLLQATSATELAQTKVGLFSSLQRSFSRRPLPGLCRAAVTELQPSIARFQNRSTRNLILAEIGKHASEGQLRPILKIATNTARLQEDAAGYRAARVRYLENLAQQEKANESIANIDAEAHIEGRLYAPIFAAGTSVFSFVLLLYLVL